MKKLLMLCLGLLLLAVNAHAQAGDYRYVSQEEMKTWLEASREILVVDIQPAKDFARQHFSGALATNAFPVETTEEQMRLDRAVESAKGNSKDVVVVCPRGKGGAKRCYDYLKANGVTEERLFILTDGMDKWPHNELVKSN